MKSTHKPAKVQPAASHQVYLKQVKKKQKQKNNNKTEQTIDELWSYEHVFHHKNVEILHLTSTVWLNKLNWSWILIGFVGWNMQEKSFGGKYELVLCCCQVEMCDLFYRQNSTLSQFSLFEQIAVKKKKLGPSRKRTTYGINANFGITKSKGKKALWLCFKLVYVATVASSACSRFGALSPPPPPLSDVALVHFSRRRSPSPGWTTGSWPRSGRAASRTGPSGSSTAAAPAAAASGGSAAAASPACGRGSKTRDSLSVKWTLTSKELHRGRSEGVN